MTAAERIEQLKAERDRARAVAVALEQELAGVLAAIRLEVDECSA